MATALEFFKRINYMTVGTKWQIRNKENLDFLFHVEATIAYVWESRSKYLRFFIPENHMPHDSILEVLDNIDQIWHIENNATVQTGIFYEEVSSKDLVFNGKVEIWVDCPMDRDYLTSIASSYRDKGLWISFRDREFVQYLSSKEKPLGFICHDSRDKEEFVGKLANKLYDMMCPVWYDEFSLKAGDSLRDKIEQGIKDSKYFLIVISKNLIENQGWVRREFESAYMKEIIEKSHCIIPIWHNVTRDEVYNLSPMLINRVALLSRDGIENVARKVAHVLLSKD